MAMDYEERRLREREVRALESIAASLTAMVDQREEPLPPVGKHFADEAWSARTGR